MGVAGVAGDGAERVLDYVFGVLCLELLGNSSEERLYLMVGIHQELGFLDAEVLWD